MSLDVFEIGMFPVEVLKGRSEQDMSRLNAITRYPKACLAALSLAPDIRRLRLGYPRSFPDLNGIGVKTDKV